MATCGEYELERAIGWGRRATFFAARSSGTTGPAVIVIRRARMVERTHRHAFLRAAAEQQAAVGAGCRRLAPILAFDCDESGFAYYATARYETSLAEFLEAACKVDSALLREIVTSVLAALGELHEKSRRAHGNLTPGNILLDPQGRIFLTDLAPSAKDATTADDLFALGTLIYQLVRRTARIGMLNPPLDYSQDWTDSLGDDAEGWREFTNRLLTKSRNAGAGAIKLASGELKSLAGLAAKAAVAAKVAVAASPLASGELPAGVRRPAPKKRSALPMVIVIILLLAGGGGGYVWWKNKEAEKARIARELEDERQRKIIEALPPAIKNLRAELKTLPDEITNDKTLKSLLGRIGKSLDGSGSKNDVTSLLGNWEVPDRMKAQAAAWRNAPREWTFLAGQLEAAAQIDAESDTSLIEQLRDAITVRNAADDLDRVWGEVTFILKDLAAENNRLLPDFTPWAVNEILAAKRVADGAVRAQDALGELREVLVFQREKGALILWARFENEAGEVVKTPASGLMQGWPDRWMQKAKGLTGPADAKREEWTQLLAAAKARISKLAPKTQPPWQSIVVDLEARTGRAAALESEVAAIDVQFAKFKGMRLPIEDAKEQYLASLARLKTAGKDVADNGTKQDAQGALDQFETEIKTVLARFDSETKTRLADYQKTIGTADLVARMRAALATKDRINLQFANPDDWEDKTPAAYDPNAAIFTYKKTLPVPFLALPNMPFAMSAFETSLILARLSGAVAGAPGDGPQIRRIDGFFSIPDWLWKGPKDLETMGIPYLGGVLAGDTSKDYCPATWLTFKEAADMAAKLGGQLPTTEQWSSASKRAGAVKFLRGKAWSDQIKYLPVLLKRTQSPPPGPDFGSFSKKTGLNGADRQYVSDPSVAPGASPDEGKLWLKMVAQDNSWKPTSGFLHLIGNAAEWVNAEDDPSKPARPTVIGGSVVSPPSLPTDKPLPVNDGAYFDVTFRLVVPLGPGGARAGLEKFQEEARTIPEMAIPAAQ